MANEPDPPDPPDVIAARYADAAKGSVTAAARLAMDVFDQVNGHPPGSYGPHDAITSITRLAGAALAGGMSLARVGLQVQWDRRVLLVADNIASIVGNGLADALSATGSAAQALNDAPRDRQVWLDTAIRLTNIGMLRGAEILETAVAGPGAYANPIIKRTFAFPMEDPAAEAARQGIEAKLAITRLVRTLDNADIKALATFDPPSCTLRADERQFTIVLNTAGLPSGLYEGAVKATYGAQEPRELPIAIAIPETDDPAE